MTIICGDCLEEMRKMEDNSISAVVTDPPYGLSFMGKGWDHVVPDQKYWEQCLRVTKAGGYLFAFGGARCFHRLAGAIEDSGYELRDCVMWIYGSGFPKSHNHFGIDGYGTALKPAYEPIIMAMKPCDGTFKQNAEKWGQAGINIDGCRIGTNVETCPNTRSGGIWTQGEVVEAKNHNKGRWPANVILDEEAAKMLDESIYIEKRKNKTPFHSLDVPDREKIRSLGASRFFYCAKASSSERNEGLERLERLEAGVGALRDSGRGKTSANNHPTVKPLKLMEYLIKLIMPHKDGILLDPFAGSGTTILAAHKLGLKAIGIEKQPEYAEMAKSRIEYFKSKQGAQPDFLDSMAQ
jgi:site-specific DNA-methyltransferase (adenine-specific)